MKCHGIKNNLNLTFDGEVAVGQKRQLLLHLTVCVKRYDEALLRQTVGNLLKRQPEILPDESFDKRMLKIFEDFHYAEKTK